MNSYELFDAKYYFNTMLKEYFNPMLKLNGFKKIKPNSWERHKGNLKCGIRLQKSTSNIKTGILFCFWIGLIYRYNGKEYAYGTRQDFYLTTDRVAYKEKNHQSGWYLIFRNVEEYDKMLEILKDDFEKYILPVFDLVNSEEVMEKIVQKEKKENGKTWYVYEYVKKELIT